MNIFDKLMLTLFVYKVSPSALQTWLPVIWYSNKQEGVGG